MIKSGANESDIVKIQKLAKEGKTSEQIATELSIVESCIKSFMPSVKEPPKGTRKKTKCE